MDLKDRVFELLTTRKNVFLVGESDSGKTYFVTNELIPFLVGKRLEVHYFKNCDEVTRMNGIAIVDEVESFQDIEFLEKAHPEEIPYYSDEYIKKVNRWFEKLKDLNEPAVFLISRPGWKEVENFARTIKISDWSEYPTEALIFKRGDSL